MRSQQNLGDQPGATGPPAPPQPWWSCDPHPWWACWCTSWRAAIRWSAAGLAVALLGGLLCWHVLHEDSTPRPAASDAVGVVGAGADVAVPIIPPAQVPNLAGLPVADVFATLPAASTGDTGHLPLDDDPQQLPTTGLVVHPTTLTPVFVAPGGPALAALAPTQAQLGSPTWLPVLQQRPGWLRVELPARPNGLTGWLTDSATLTKAASTDTITVNRRTFTLTLTVPGTARSWTVGVGKPASPTPVGRTFVDAQIRPTAVHYSPIIMPLGWHSDTYTSYGGGPGVVGLHGWPSSAVFGHAASDGCVRVPPDALTALSQVPLGTPVLITQ